MASFRNPNVTQPPREPPDTHAHSNRGRDLKACQRRRRRRAPRGPVRLNRRRGIQDARDRAFGPLRRERSAPEGVARRPREQGPGAHRPERLRQEHVPPVAQPDERHRRRASRSTGTSSSTGATSTAPDVDPVLVRRRVGMVFQRSNPFPKSIFENVAYGLRIAGVDRAGLVAERGRAGAAARGALGRGEGPPPRVGRSASPAGSSSASASRARSPSSPRCSSWTSRRARSTRSPPRRSRTSSRELRGELTIVIVTHNMQQAARVSQRTGFFYMGRLVEVGETTHDLHAAERARDRGLHHRAIRLIASLRTSPSFAARRSSRMRTVSSLSSSSPRSRSPACDKTASAPGRRPVRHVVVDLGAGPRREGPVGDGQRLERASAARQRREGEVRGDAQGAQHRGLRRAARRRGSPTSRRAPCRSATATSSRPTT